MRTLFLLRGAPASGKSTWIETNNLRQYTLSADEVRLMYQGPVTNLDGSTSISQGNDTEVWKLLLTLLEKRMSKGELVIVDATHYKAPLLNRYLDLVDKYRYRAYVIDFTNISLEQLLNRNSKRGFKAVPEETIDKMYVALQDTSEIKKRYKIISPSEGLDLVKNDLVPYKMEYDRVVVFGDIHGCYQPLKEYFEQNPIDENTCYVFTGDYIDRGLENKEVLEFLIENYNRPNFRLLEGNHEKWLRIYSEADYDVEFYESKPNEYQDIFIYKALLQLTERENSLKKKINENTTKAEELHRLLETERNKNKDTNEVYYKFELINVPLKRKELFNEIFICQKHLEKVQRYIAVLKHEEHNTKDYLYKIRDEYKEMFKCDLGLDIRGVLSKHYSVTANKIENPIKSLEFLKRTYNQIKDINKSDLRQLCRKFAQMFYFEFNNRVYLVNHGGLPDLPRLTTATEEIIKGVGTYEQVTEVDSNFVFNTPDNYIQIHAHRNIMCDPVEQHNGRIYNLESKVEYGGYLSIVEITQEGHKVIQIKNNNYIEEEKEEVKEETQTEILKKLYESKYIQTKDLKRNVVSFNFTRDAFEGRHWNEQTCTARGLFADKTNGNIVARSYPKFFNYKEVEETKPQELKKNLKFPLVGYKKENGFLGLISKYDNDIYFFTKSSDDGDYVNWFIGVLCDHYNIYPDYCLNVDLFNKSYTYIYKLKLQAEKEGDLECISKLDTQLDLFKQKLVNHLNPILANNTTYIFECVDIENDPHIIKYASSKVYLLDVVNNDLTNTFLDYRHLYLLSEDLEVPVKEQLLYFYNWEQFEDWKEKFHQGITQWDCKHEGYVFEDAEGFRFKMKSSYYKFWKQMRNLKEIIQGGRTNKKIYKTKEEIQVVKLLESFEKDKLKEMSIIDIQDLFYKNMEKENV